MTDSNSCSVELVGSLGLRDVADVATRLQSALAEHDEVVASVSGLVDIDLTIVQVLIAANRSANAVGKTLRIEGTHNAALRQLLRNAGFISAQNEPLTGDSLFRAAGSNAA